MSELMVKLVLIATLLTTMAASAQTRTISADFATTAGTWHQRWIDAGCYNVSRCRFGAENGEGQRSFYQMMLITSAPQALCAPVWVEQG